MISDTDKRFCSILIDVMEAHGVKDIVCSPGSRNTPLLIAAAAREIIRKHVVIDERSAAFMALGLSMVSRRPVALICTSGTAPLNYAPALAEAFYQGVPLIAVTADRPEQWIDQDDSQTLRQTDLFSNFVKKSYELPAIGEDDSEMQWFANRLGNDAMIVATTPKEGPVHINVRLSDPLGRKTDRLSQGVRTISILSADAIGDKEKIRTLALEASSKKILFVAGFMPPDSRMQKSASDFCSLPNVAAMTETLSNLHLSVGATDIDSVLTAYDDNILDSAAPDIVITTGGALVSRKLKEYLRRNSSHTEHWAIGHSHTTADCFMAMTRRIEVDPARFLRQLFAVMRKNVRTPIPSNHSYSSIWNDLRGRASEAKNDFISKVPWSGIKAFKTIFDRLPRQCNLFLSNGTSVRYAQILCHNLPHASYCNRGVSGIDGSTSTAVGGAVAYPGMTILITGDMSMAYDINALSLPGIPDRMKIIVFDNNGGGIFRFIPTTSSLEEREEYFCTPPILPLRQLAEAYGWNYAEADNEKQLSEILPSFFSSPHRTILRVIVNGEVSARILKDYMKIKATI